MQLSVYSGQQTILSSWLLEVQTGWHANEARRSDLFFSTSHSLQCYDYIMCFPFLLLIVLSFISTLAHRTCIMLSSVHPTSCYNFSFGFIPAVYFVIILDQQIHLLTHRFMFIFFLFFLSHLVHVRSVYIGPVEALIPDNIVWTSGSDRPRV